MSREYIETITTTNELFSEPKLLKFIHKTLEFLSPSSSDISANVTNDTLSLLKTELPDWSIRPRKGSNYKDLLFAFPGDCNGVFYWIATDGLTTRWVNPHKVSKLTVSSSSPVSRYSKPEALVGRSFLTTSYINGSPAWWKVDLNPHMLK